MSAFLKFYLNLTGCPFSRHTLIPLQTDLPLYLKELLLWEMSEVCRAVLEISSRKSLHILKELHLELTWKCFVMKIYTHSFHLFFTLNYCSRMNNSTLEWEASQDTCRNMSAPIIITAILCHLASVDHWYIMREHIPIDPQELHVSSSKKEREI